MFSQYIYHAGGLSLSPSGNKNPAMENHPIENRVCDVPIKSRIFSLHH